MLTDTEYDAGLAFLVEESRHDFVTFLNFMYPQVEDENYKISEVHEYIANTIQDMLLGNANPQCAVSLPPQHGKALEESTLIPTPVGFKKIGKLMAGDSVYAPDGTVTQVMAVAHWTDRPTYRLTMDDGSTIEADEQHEWAVSLRSKRRNAFTVRSTKFLAERKSSRAAMLPEVFPVQYSEKRQMIPAYILGCWLGGGSRRGKEFTAAESDQEHYFQRFASLGFSCRQAETVKTRFSLQNSGWFQGWLRSWGLMKKFIPKHYLLGSVEQRYDLLRGLIDTNGYVATDGQVEFCSTSKQLAEDTLTLIHSLGIKAALIHGRATLNGKDCGPKHRIMFYAEGVASLPRKVSNLRRPKKRMRYIEKVEYVGLRNTTCIEVDHPSHLFLAGPHYIPTHNSRLIAVRFVAWALGAFPRISIAMTGYSFTLLTEFLREATAIMETTNYLKVFPTVIPLKGWDRVNSKRYKNGSSILCKSCGSKLTGRRVDLLIIDDPHPGRFEAESAVCRKKVVQWYFADCVSRLSPKAKQFIIATRWHPQDLIGHLTSEEYERGLEVAGHADKKFRIINFPAICKTDDDEISRVLGDPLFPAERPLKFLQAIRASVPAYEWESQYQGNPMSSGGGQIAVNKLQRICMDEFLDRDEVNNFEFVRGWDLALTTAQRSDYSAGPLIAYDKNNDLIYIVDMWWDKKVWTEMRPELVKVALRDRDEWGVNRIGMEAVGGFSIGYDEVKADLSGEIKVEKKNPKGKDKLIRAQPWINKVEAGKVFMVEGEWNREFLAELSVFPDGDHDDQVDGMSVATELVLRPAKMLYA